MKKFLTLAIFFSITTITNAQTTDSLMLSHPKWMASSYAVYPDPPKDYKMTKAPAGYKPFYLSHYGRHGSRYHYSKEDYQMLYDTFAKADSLNALSEFGKDVLKRFDRLNQFAGPRAGDLTEKGAEQHKKIANRMYKNFPEIFKGKAQIDVVASTSTRCIMSMSAATGELRSLNPKLEIHQESSKRLMHYISPFDFKYTSEYAQTKEWQAENDKLYKNVNPDRILNALFNPDYIQKNINKSEFYTKLYEISSSVQGMTEGAEDFGDLWTKEELLYRWKAQNAWWYSVLGNCPLTGNRGITFAKPLLKQIMIDMQSAIETKKISAHLRYGHDTAILPLAGLMQLSIAGANTKDIENLHTQWTDFKIIPMAANLQIILYKSAKKDEPILVKFLYNEIEVTAPISCSATNEKKCPAAPYYRLDDVIAFFEKAIN
ncbi:MAG: histidine-type phosphatase [Fibrobacter sp.]|nr:histidine-type phosphatase [Fibrobacter sp.]